MKWKTFIAEREEFMTKWKEHIIKWKEHIIEWKERITKWKECITEWNDHIREFKERITKWKKHIIKWKEHMKTTVERIWFPHKAVSAYRQSRLIQMCSDQIVIVDAIQFSQYGLIIEQLIIYECLKIQLRLNMWFFTSFDITW